MMAHKQSFLCRLGDNLALLYYWVAARGWVSPKGRARSCPTYEQRTPFTQPLAIEVVSHCWRYSHFLAYQLSSLVKFPPAKLGVTMTVFYSAEDEPTVRLLAHFGALDVPGVSWNWQVLPKEYLFRRAIGRNIAALNTKADWVWFTDCDVVFGKGCVDGLANALEGRRDALVFPREERVTALLSDLDPMLAPKEADAGDFSIDAGAFTSVRRLSRATGPMQITHGDVARACGYCDSIPIYQKPATKWRKAVEDRAFRWLLGTQGVALDVPGVYRIRHAEKGRYTGNGFHSRVRRTLRRVQSALFERGNHSR